jgi:hypothetical protein
MSGSCHLKADKGDGERASQAGVLFQEGDVGPDHAIPESGLQVAQLRRRPLGASNRRRLIRP